MIVLGYAFARFHIVDAATGRGLGLFVFNAAIPALLFRTTATMDLANVAPWNLWFAYFGGLGLAWIAAALIAPHVASLNVSAGAAAGMATGFGNLALLGTPLALSHFGTAVAVPLGLILSIHAPILWSAATLHREIGRHAADLHWARIGRELFSNLARNAIVLALLAGAIWRATGWGLHPVPDKMLAMLADASVPTALFALGVSLAGYGLRGAWQGMLVLILLKMLLMPVLVFLLAWLVFPLPPLYLKIAVLFAAMPTGANAFLFAQRNDEAVAAVSGAVAIGTGLAAVSASVLLYLMDSGLM